MKISRKKKNDAHAKLQQHKLLMMDEWKSPEVPFLDMRPYTKIMIATQAIYLKNSGKRIRLMSSAKWENGDPIKPPVKKFIPKQVLRRLA